MTMSRPTTIIGFGALSIDDIYYVDAQLQAGKGRVVRRASTFGGNVATALVAAARLGGEASFIGWLNEDPDDPIVTALKTEGVCTDDAPLAAGCQPVRSTITVGSDGDRFIAFDDDVLLGTAPDLPDTVLTSAGVLLIDGYATRSPEIVIRARSLGLPVIADIEWSEGETTDLLLEACDHLVLPFGFAHHYTGHKRPQAVLNALWSDQRSAVVLTDGPNGVYLLEADHSPCHLPSHSVSVVDTTGAGDCFHGAYAVALVRGYGVRDCVRFAAAAAALSVTGRGGREALPKSPAVDALLEARDAPDFAAL